MTVWKYAYFVLTSADGFIWRRRHGSGSWVHLSDIAYSYWLRICAQHEGYGLVFEHASDNKSIRVSDHSGPVIDQNKN